MHSWSAMRVLLRYVLLQCVSYEVHQMCVQDDKKRRKLQGVIDAARTSRRELEKEIAKHEKKLADDGQPAKSKRMKASAKNKLVKEINQFQVRLIQ